MTWVVRAIRSSGGVARPRSVAFSSSTMHDRDEIWVAKGRRRVGDGDGPDSPGRLTKNRTLVQPPHGKPQFGRSEARRMRFSVRTRAQNALFRHVAAPGRCGATPPPGCGALWRMSQLGKCARATPRQAVGWVARGFANLGLEFGLTEKRILKPSGPATSPKTALCSQCPTKNRTLQPVPHQKPQFGWSEARRTRLSVRTRAQSALFRDVPRSECAFP